MNKPTPVIYTGQSSAECVKSFFDMHIKETMLRGLDLTYGQGTFWDWNTSDIFLKFTCNDKYVDGMDSFDFRATGYTSRNWDVVVFDPPFTANGPSKDGHQKRYGADRSQDGAPKNIHEVRSLLASGLIEAMRLSKRWVILKTQDVIESGKLHDCEGLARDLFRHFGFRIVDYRLFLSHRRPQPDGARNAKQKHFRDRPSVFYLAKRGT